MCVCIFGIIINNSDIFAFIKRDDRVLQHVLPEIGISFGSRLPNTYYDEVEEEKNLNKCSTTGPGHPAV